MRLPAVRQLLLRRPAPRVCRRVYSASFSSSSSSTPPPPSIPPSPPSKPVREYTTPLAKQLTEAITTTGPVPLATYMRQCLTSDTGGYYTTSTDPFGRAGDFVTSPEISQLFGEMLGVWVVSEWLAQGKPREVQLVELGPGRGTLMEDVLRTLTAFRSHGLRVSHIHLVEASPTLRKIQAARLCGEDTHLLESPPGVFTAHSTANIPVTWHDSLSSVPALEAPFILAHEFFDALPIHVFEATSAGWRELLISPTAPGSPEEFALTRAQKVTPSSVMLPQLSPRYKALEKAVGSIIEISPESLAIMEDLAKRIGAAKAGAALVVDYGPLDTIPINSLRGIRGHKIVSPLSAPGAVDLSADVDFHGLAERALDVSEEVEVHGPVEQGAFLLTMGMTERMVRLVKGLEEKEKERVVRSFERLVERGGGGMGRVYKVLAVVPERGGKRPVGFGGAVEGV